MPQGFTIPTSPIRINVAMYLIVHEEHPFNFPHPVQVEGQAGNGPKPFAFDRDNELVLRLILGASLRNLPSGNVILGEKLGLALCCKKQSGKGIA